MADPVSWLVVDRGWRVVGCDGEETGKVDEVLGDRNLDIFDGLVITSGLFGRRRYVPAEDVSGIVDGCVELSLDSAKAQRLGEYKPHAPKSSQR
jgi:hypothetical protein